MMEGACNLDKLPASFSGTAVPVIDRLFTWSIIPVRKRPRSSMAEQLPLKQFVEGSSPPGVTKIQGLMHKIIVCQTLGF